MVVIDEYLAVRVLLAQWPEELPPDELALPTSRHWRLLQALHGGRGGQLSQVLALLSEVDQVALRHPHQEVLQVLDPRPLLDDAAVIAARYGGTGWLVAETLAAGVAYSQLWFGAEHNVGQLVARAAPELGVTVHVAN